MIRIRSCDAGCVGEIVGGEASLRHREDGRGCQQLRLRRSAGATVVLLALMLLASGFSPEGLRADDDGGARVAADAAYAADMVEPDPTATGSATGSTRSGDSGAGFSLSSSKGLKPKNKRYWTNASSPCDEYSEGVNGVHIRTSTEQSGRRNGLETPGQSLAGAAVSGAASIQARDVSFELGDEEVVVDWEKEHCQLEDLPDVVPQIIRNADRRIVLKSGGPPGNYWSFGRGLNDLKRICHGVMESVNSPDVEAFKPFQWITSLYTEDGITVHALIHNEYHDPHAPNCLPGIQSSANPCWYNFISYAVSTDGGYTYTQPHSPDHLVAPFPYQWNPVPIAEDWELPYPPAYGYMEPSNIIKHPTDGYYYVMFRRNDPQHGESGTCVMRTTDLSDPSSWRAWDGAGFSLRMVNPYPTEPEDPAGLLCKFVSKKTINELHSNVTYNWYLQRFLLVGADVLEDEDGQVKCGFWFSLSDDLINWDPAKLIFELFAPFSPCDQNVDLPGRGYPAIIDHDDVSLSFDQTGQVGYLYYATDGYGDGLQGPTNPDFGGAFDTDVVRRRIILHRDE